MTNPTDRFHSCDSLRGIAALIVVFHHALLTLPTMNQDPAVAPIAWGSDMADHLVWLLFHTPLYLLWAGGEAVMFFFVLSGFVLALPFADGRAPDWPNFVIKRLTRIYLPFLAAVFLADLGATLLHGRSVAGAGPWLLPEIWANPADAAIYADHLLMLGDPRLNLLDPPIWSLVHEMRISLAFPLLAAIVLSLPLRLSLPVFAAISALSVAALKSGLVTVEDGSLQSLTVTGKYTILFVLGIAVAKHRQALRTMVADLSPAATLGLLALALMLLNHRANFAAHPVGADALGGLGASLLLIVALGSPRIDRLLTLAPFRWLGRVSYSLYLTHMIVQLTLLKLFGGLDALWLAPPAALAFAALFHRWVEQPAQMLGYRLTRRKGEAAMSAR